MRKLLFTFACLCVLASLARAQDPTYPTTYSRGGNLTTSSANCDPTACLGIGLPTPSAAVITVGLTGTWSGTLAVEESQDGGRTFTSAGASLTSTGTSSYVIAGFTSFRVRAGTLSSGNVGVNFTVSNAPSGGVTSGTGAPSGSCTANQIYVNQSNGNLYTCSAGSWVLSGGGGSGTVTNIATTGPITGGPITTTGTIACPTCETSAGVTANAILKSSGGQVAIASTITDGGSGAQVGSPTGGAEGAGTLNATGLYQAGVQDQTVANVGVGCMSACSYGVALGTYAPAAFGGTTTLMNQSGAANQPQFIRFYNQSLSKLGNATVRVTTIGAAGHFSVGVYSISGTTATLIWTTGSQSTTSAVNIQVTPTPVNLNAGTNYYVAWCSDSVTAALAGVSSAATTNSMGSTGAANSYGVDTVVGDACTAGVLPSTATTTNITNNAASSVAGIYATN